MIAVVLLLIWISFRFDLGERLGEVRHWIDAQGSAAPAIFVAIYVVATIFAVPAVALTVSAGALFGTFWGVVLVSIASTTGAALAFLIGRYLARDKVARWAQGHERFQRLDRMTERHGWIVVLLTRLVPLFPFNLLNYGFGLTRVRFGTYVLWSWIGMLPATVVYVAGADAIAGSLDGEIDWVPVLLLLVAVVGLYFLVRKARRVLAEKDNDERNQP